MMKNSSILTLFICSCVLAATSACGGRDGQNVDMRPVVKIDTVRAIGAHDALQFPGRVVAATETSLSFKVAGTLKKVYVAEGSVVRAGQLIAELDPSDYEVQLSATEAEYAQVKAEAERVMGLYAEGGTTASNYDKARYGLQQIEAKLQHHRNQLAYTRITAPVSGTVQTRYFDGGETVGAGMPIVSVISTGNLEVEVNLPPATYARRESFSGFSCTLDVLPGRVIPLEMVSILPKANSNQLYTMRLRISQADEALAAGMTAWVRVLTAADTEGVVRIPTTSLRESDGRTSVFRYDGQTSAVSEVQVTVQAVHTDGTVEVRGALRPGELIVTSGVHHIVSGDNVRLLQPTSKSNVGGLL